MTCQAAAAWGPAPTYNQAHLRLTMMVMVMVMVMVCALLSAVIPTITMLWGWSKFLKTMTLLVQTSLTKTVLC